MDVNGWSPSAVGKKVAHCSWLPLEEGLWAGDQRIITFQGKHVLFETEGISLASLCKARLCGGCTVHQTN
ncbi:unnamed protein product [Merluccius merluccius]